MTITDGYCILDELKSYANITTGARDSHLEIIIEAVSRLIDSATGHNFATQTNATARVFSASHSDLVEVDDFYETTALVIKTDDDADGTYETTWTTSDYQLEPLNGITKGRAVWRIRRKVMGDYWFPVSDDALVQVTAKWGWVTVPKPIREACKMHANRIANRPQSPLGLVQAPDFGTQDRLAAFDPDVRDLLRPYTRLEAPL